MMNPARILIVEEDLKLARSMQEALTANGYETLMAGGGNHVAGMVAMEQPDLILVDVILPGNLDGYEVARSLREFSDAPIVMLTMTVNEADLARGFECGADDYLTRPFSANELLARVWTALRRARVETAAPAEADVVCGDVTIALSQRRVVVAGNEIHLTPTEYSLLAELARHTNRVLFHEHLLTAIWGPEYRNDVDYLRTYIHYLRRKLEPDPANPRMIVSIPGVGYMLAVPETNLQGRSNSER